MKKPATTTDERLRWAAWREAGLYVLRQMVVEAGWDRMPIPLPHTLEPRYEGCSTEDIQRLEDEIDVLTSNGPAATELYRKYQSMSLPRSVQPSLVHDYLQRTLPVDFAAEFLDSLLSAGSSGVGRRESYEEWRQSRLAHDHRSIAYMHEQRQKEEAATKKWSAWIEEFERHVSRVDEDPTE